MRHEVHLARAGFLALAAIAVVAMSSGAIVAGSDGLRSAFAGVALVSINHAVAVASTGWSRVLGPRVIAVGYSVMVVRLLFILGSFSALATLEWVHDGFLAGSFCAALFASLAAECVSYARGTYVPSWRTR